MDVYHQCQLSDNYGFIVKVSIFLPLIQCKSHKPVENFKLKLFTTWWKTILVCFEFDESNMSQKEEDVAKGLTATGQ